MTDILDAFDAQATEVKLQEGLVVGFTERWKESHARALAAETEVENLRADLADLRASHAKLMRAIKAKLGFKHWPKIEGNVVDWACAALADAHEEKP